jgi:hypothetical protein
VWNGPFYCQHSCAVPLLSQSWLLADDLAVLARESEFGFAVRVTGKTASPAIQHSCAHRGNKVSNACRIESSNPRRETFIPQVET